MYPFVLAVGTKNPTDFGEEYRWAILPFSSIPARNAVFCRDNDGNMRTDFLLKTFWRPLVYPSYQALTIGIRQYHYVGRSYVLQIEHFPDDLFPTITDGA